ncbi:hypothetical protein C8Q79DRAFT_755487 [Trametes meyenii]|nr:hypothetical protein C8Q79DRAFT_755487 [Trametes meyenii]
MVVWKKANRVRAQRGRTASTSSEYLILAGLASCCSRGKHAALSMGVVSCARSAPDLYKRPIGWIRERSKKLPLADVFPVHLGVPIGWEWPSIGRLTSVDRTPILLPHLAPKMRPASSKCTAGPLSLRPVCCAAVFLRYGVHCRRASTVSSTSAECLSTAERGPSDAVRAQVAPGACLSRAHLPLCVRPSSMTSREPHAVFHSSPAAVARGPHGRLYR